jgi:glycosyltransferase involved in cell wall biosynthesis
MISDPQISVIVPVYNDPDGLRDTLNSLTEQRSSSHYEIIVVDNNSTDETPQVIEEFEREYPDIVYDIKETDVQSSYAARNAGIKNASGEILAFIDANVTVNNDWIERIVGIFEEKNVDYLGCNVEMYISGGEDSIWAQYDASTGLTVEYYLETKNSFPRVPSLFKQM